ncbi:hypothetical protein BST61_g10309 [Cercospora zeina]
MAAPSNTSPRVIKIDASIMQPMHEHSPKPRTTSPGARAANAEEVFQWSRKLIPSIPRQLLKEARKAVGAGADSQQFRGFVQAHHLSFTAAEFDRETNVQAESLSSSKASGRSTRFTLPPLEFVPVGRHNSLEDESTGGSETSIEEEGSESEDDDDDVVIITGDEDTKSGWTFPGVSQRDRKDSEQADSSEAHNAPGLADEPLQNYPASYGDKKHTARANEMETNDILLTHDTATKFDQALILPDISLIYDPIARVITFHLPDSAAIAKARAFCQNSAIAAHDLKDPERRDLTVVVKYLKPSTTFPNLPIGMATATVSHGTVGDIVRAALAMRLGGGKWKAKAKTYVWTKEMLSKARKEGAEKLVDVVRYERVAENNGGLDAEEVQKQEGTVVEKEDDGIAGDVDGQAPRDEGEDQNTKAQIEDSDEESDEESDQEGGQLPADAEMRVKLIILGQAMFLLGLAVVALKAGVFSS